MSFFLVSVEDPSDNFARLRDYVDSKNCMKLESFHPEKLNQGYSEAMVDEAKRKLKLNKVRRSLVYPVNINNSQKLVQVTYSHEACSYEFKIAVQFLHYCWYRQLDVSKTDCDISV